MTTTDTRPEQKLTILKHLAGGKSIDVVATIVSVPRDLVSEIARSHGYPDIEKLAWAVDVVTKKIQEERDHLPASTVRTPAPSGPRIQTLTPPSIPARPLRTATPAEPLRIPTVRSDGLGDLLDSTKTHDHKRIQRLGAKILEDLDKLRALIDEDADAAAARQARAAQKSQARAEIARLKTQLADAQAALRAADPPRPSSSGATSPLADQGGPSSAEVRAWAAASGVDCPKVGRVPTAVREAYAAAHPVEDA